MNSSEAVFGNRFIKMFFNNPDRGLSVKDRLGESTNERVSADGKTITKTIINSEASVAAGKDSSTEQPSASAESQPLAPGFPGPTAALPPWVWHRSS